jgi:predicted nucleic acid-binding protein
MAFIAVLDASVLFTASLRDALLWSAKADLYRVHITEDILEELCRNLILKRDVAPEKANYLAETIRDEFCDVTDTRYKLLVSAMPINEKDRHVMATAVSPGAQVIVTQNLQKFCSSKQEHFVSLLKLFQIF